MNASAAIADSLLRRAWRKDIAPQSFGTHGTILNNILIHQPSEHHIAC